MGKTPKTYEEATEAFNDAKTASKEAKAELREYCKANKLKAKEDHSNHKDGKIAKRWAKLAATAEKYSKRVETTSAAAKELKPSTRTTKYVYPAGMDAGAKKIYRTACRTAAKKLDMTVDEYLGDKDNLDEKLAEMKPKKKEKKEKKEKKVEATNGEAKSSKKKKKKKNKGKVVEMTTEED